MLHERPEYKDFFNKYFPNSEFLLDVEFIKNPPAEYISDFFDKLSQHENYESLKNDFIYDKDLNLFAHIHNRFPSSEIEDLSPEEVFFYPFMDKTEIKRIFDIKTSSDFLLRVRADQVETNMRLKRIFTRLKKKIGPKWSFTNYFDSTQYKAYLKSLNLKFKNECINIPHGTIHSSEVNGMCFSTPFGNIIVLSYALRYFLYYMNVFLYGKGLGIKQEDTFHSFILAIRIMIGTESLDFEIDPRGKLPRSIRKRMDFITDWQMKFIIGHEYAHHYLGHLKSKSFLKSHSKIFDSEMDVKHYTYSQQNEFEADSHAITETVYESFDKAQLLNGAFYFFLAIHMYDRVEDYLFPKITTVRTHPEPLERLFHLRKTIKEDLGFSIEELQSVVEYYNSFIDDFLKNYLPYNVETIEMIGSIYLPSYKKKILIDRLDF